MTEANIVTKIDKTELIAKLKAATKPDRGLDADICRFFGYEVIPSFGREYYQPDPDYSWQEVPTYTSSVDKILQLFESKSLFDHKFGLHELFQNALKALNFKYHWAVSFSTEAQRRELPIQMMLAYLDRQEEQSVKEYLEEIEQLRKDTWKHLGLEEETEVSHES